MEGYIAEIRLFAANFAPRNWGYCNGALLSIAQNTALFSLLGTTYGGNGIQTFGLPDFRSRTARGTGQGAGLSNITLGEMSGIESETISLNELPSHTHTGTATVTPSCSSGSGDESNPSGFFPGNVNQMIYSNTQNVAMGAARVSATITPSGQNQPHTNIQPSLGMNYIICLYGIFPSRN